eukprot:1157186-Pelagomonas_calceolata.AAC.14
MHPCASTSAGSSTSPSAWASQSAVRHAGLLAQLHAIHMQKGCTHTHTPLGSPSPILCAPLRSCASIVRALELQQPGYSSHE